MTNGVSNPNRADLDILLPMIFHALCQTNGLEAGFASKGERHRGRRRNHIPCHTPRIWPRGSASGDAGFPASTGRGPRSALPIQYLHGATILRPILHRNPRTGFCWPPRACVAGPGRAAQTRSGSGWGTRSRWQSSSTGRPLDAWRYDSAHFLSDKALNTTPRNTRSEKAQFS
jgi:hypothetical protein